LAASAEASSLRVAVTLLPPLAFQQVTLHTQNDVSTKARLSTLHASANAEPSYSFARGLEGAYGDVCHVWLCWPLGQLRPAFDSTRGC
jgi:hypothetical protein